VVLLRFGRRQIVGLIEALGVFVGLFENGEVRLHHVTGHVVPDEFLEVGDVEVEKRRRHRDAGGVTHDFATVLAGHAPEVDRIHVPIIFLGPGLEVVLGDVFLLDEPRVVDDDAAFSEVVQVFVQRLEFLVAVVRTLLFVAGE
jgi:hypothetical protein